jgi:hypothetical protein
VRFDLGAEFVVDWQVAEGPAGLAGAPDLSEFEILFP